MEDSFIIRGGKPLKGHIDLAGAKNASYKIIIGALLLNEEVIVPMLTNACGHRLDGIDDITDIVRIQAGNVNSAVIRTVDAEILPQPLHLIMLQEAIGEEPLLMHENAVVMTGTSRLQASR